MDVRLPDGTIVKNVPEGTTKAQLMARISKASGADHNRDGFMGKLDSTLRGATDSMTFGVADKIAAGFNAVLPLDKLTNPNIKSVWETGDLGKAFRSNLNEEQRIASDDTQNRGGYRMGGQIAGAVVGPVPGRALLARGAANIAKGAVRKGIIGAGKARLAAGAARVAGEGAIQQGLHGIGQGDSTDIGERLAEGVNQAGQGAAGALIGAGVVKGGGRLLSPVVNPAVAKLAKMGVVMTPGQRAGKGTFTNWAENAATSVPGLGVAVRAAKARGLDQYMLGAINEGLKPIGQVLPKKTQAGRAAVEAAQEIIGDHYDEALAKVVAPLDDTFRAAIDTTSARAVDLPPEQAKEFAYILKNKIGAIPESGAIDGKGLQRITRMLQTAAASADSKKNDLLADELREVRSHFLDLAARHSPDGTRKFLQANDAEANLSRIYDASSKAHGEGVPTPQQMSAATARKGYGTSTKRAAAGRARMQDVTDAGKAILPDTVPNSGTAERAAGMAAVGSIGTGGALVNPAIAGLALPAAPYLPGVDALIQKLALRGQGKNSKKLADEIRKRAYVGGIIGAPWVNAQLQSQGE